MWGEVSRERPAAMAALTPVMTEPPPPPEQQHRGEALWRQQDAGRPQPQVHSMLGTSQTAAAASCPGQVLAGPVVNGELPPAHTAAPTVWA